MAKRTVLRVPIGDGVDGFVDIEVEPRDADSSAVELTADAREGLATAAFSLASSLDKVVPALSLVVQKLRSAVHAPDTIDVELGLKVGGETGLIFAKGTTEATFKVKVGWHKQVAGSNDVITTESAE